MGELRALDSLIDALALAAAEDYLREEAMRRNDSDGSRAERAPLPREADAA